MNKKFFIDGSYVVLHFLEFIVNKENQNRTINELLKEKQLLGNEQYLLNPSLLIGCLYGTFLVHQEQIEKNGDKINECLKRYFDLNTIIKDVYKEKPLAEKIRNAIAHFWIELKEKDNAWKLTFKDKRPKEQEFHFIAEISLEELRKVIEEMSKII